jgi:CHASE3 domain sensor protein
MPDKLSLASRSWLFGIALTVPLLLLLILGVFANRSSKIVRETNIAMRQVMATKAEAAHLLIAMIDNETGQRGFILSQKPAFLEPYERSLTVIPQIRRSLALQINDPTARGESVALNTAIDSRLRFSATTVDLQKIGKHDESVALESFGEGKILMDQVRAAEAAVDSHLDRLITAQEAEYTKVAARNERISWLVVLLDCIFGGALILLLLRLRHNEQLLRVCAWSKTVEYKGEWITFEQYLSRRFGIDSTHGISPAEERKLMSELRKVQSD